MNSDSFFKTIDLSRTPYSCAGSWLAVSRLDERHGVQTAGLYLRTNRELFSYAPLFRLELLKNGESVAFREQAVPGALRLETAAGDTAELTWEESTTIRFRSSRLGCRLYRAGGISLAHAIGSDFWRFVWRGESRSDNALFLLESLCGKAVLRSRWDGMTTHDMIWTIEPKATAAEFAFSESFLEPAGKNHRLFDICKKETATGFEAFLNSFPAIEPFAAERFLALYQHWSQQVAPSGLLKRRCMLASKNKMSGMWAWDHCFNALALAKAQPEFAFDQFMAMFDQQNEQGAIPDLLTPTISMQVHVKPPVHGWIFSRMRQANAEFFQQTDVTRQVYDALCNWTRYWTEFRDYGGIGLPCYTHGKDSGWDNATLFLNPMPLASPDLSSYLILQMELLSELAAQLGRRNESGMWRESARKLLECLLKLAWDGESFHAVSTEGKQLPQSGDCLLVYLPLLLGNRLPAEMATELSKGLSRFRTPYGVATERPESPYYEPAGYWRGPIWAPATSILISGLAGCGESEYAEALARDYCRLCAGSSFYENFDALTGKGNDEKTISWSASVFLVLSEQYQ